jgi:GTP-binding protein
LLLSQEVFRDRPEIAMVGRSNAGKSSLLNTMIGSEVAYVGKTPGKTRLLNFFDVGNHYRIVDLPGYGYAARHTEEIEMWNEMITNYINGRENLKGLVLICDVRREWTHEEEMIVNFTKIKNMKFCCVLNKIDKLGRSDLNERILNWVKTSHREKDFFHQISTLKKTGVREFEEFIFKNWVKSK